MADKCYVCGITWADWQASLLTRQDTDFGTPCEDGEIDHDWED